MMLSVTPRPSTDPGEPRGAAAARGAPRLRVLHLIDSNVAYSYMVSFAKYGDHERFEYTIASLAAPGELQTAVRRYGAGSFGMSVRSRSSYPKAILRLARWMSRERIDVVHPHLFDPSVVGLVAARLARVPHTVFTAHHVSEWEVARLGSARAGALDRFVRTRFADHVIAPSEYIAGVLRACDGREAASLTVIPHGIDAGEFVAARTHRERTRAELGLTGSTVLGAVGRISPVKNYPALIRAFATIASEDPSLVLVIVGQGSGGELGDLAGALGVEDRVRFLGWRQDIGRVMSAFDVFVHVALTETFGKAPLEALAAGVPVVASAVGIAPVVINHGTTGVLLAGTDEDSILKGLREILQHPERWEMMRAAGQEKARPYSESRMVKAHEALYGRLEEAST